jgi:hypothetical protein
MNDLTVSGAKALARGMVDRMAALGVPMTYAQALEAVAASHQYSDWNRFLDALKKGRVQLSSPGKEEHRPHRLIVTAPGFGCGAVIDHDFLFEASQPGVLPVMIRFNNAPLDSYLFQQIVPSAKVTVMHAMYDDIASDKIVFSGSLPLDGTGLIINIWSPPNQLISAWKAMLPLIPSLFQHRHLEMPGTLFIEDLHRVDRQSGDDYDVCLPQLMKALRAFGGKKSLVVTTQTDAARESLYRSPDAWKVIMLAGDDTRLFYRCPFERVFVYPFEKSAQSYFARLFSDRNRQLEDAALWVGSMKRDHYSEPLVNESAYGASLLKYFADNHAWHIKGLEEKAARAVSIDDLLKSRQAKIDRQTHAHRNRI